MRTSSSTPHLLGAVVLLTLMLLLSFTYSASTVQTDILIILQSASEVASVAPIVEALEPNCKQSITLLLIGNAEDALYGSNPHLYDISLSLADDLCVEEFNNTFNSEQLATVPKQISTQVIITGMSSLAQLQIVEAYVALNQSIKVIAYYNQFIWYPSHIMNQFVNTRVDQVWVTSDDINAAVIKKNKSWKNKVITVGDPAIQIWIQQRLNVTDSDIIRHLSSTLRTDLSKKPIISYIGGSGKQYEDSLESYLIACRDTQLYDVFNVIVALSIDSDASFESELLSDLGLKDQVFLLSWSYASAVRVSLVSKFVTSYDSNSNVNCLFYETPSVYYQTTTASINSVVNTAVDTELSYLCRNTSQFRSAIVDMRQENFKINSTKLNYSGIPKDSLVLALEVIDELDIANLYLRNNTLKQIQKKHLDWCPLNPVTRTQMLIIAGVTLCLLGVCGLLVTVSYLIAKCVPKQKKGYEPLF